jgi:alpha-tubulin suppressor-like RCC1 family protein
MVLFDTGEVYHTGYGAQGNNGDATTTNRNYYIRVGRSSGAGRGTGVLRDKFIVKVGTSDKTGGGADQNMETHTCFAISNAGEVFTWGYF